MSVGLVENSVSRRFVFSNCSICIARKLTQTLENVKSESTETFENV